MMGMHARALWVVMFLAWAFRAVAGETATAIATISSGYVTDIALVSHGSGYVSEPMVEITGGGGSGATARAILDGDQVGRIIILTAGTGYTTPPEVVIQAPPRTLGLRMELIPKLTVEGPPGVRAVVESAVALTGPWEAWTNVFVGAEGVVLVDLRAGLAARFYRAVPGGPPGFVWIQPGSFVMGSPETEEGRFPDEVQHTVTLTRGFWISDHETTQEEYESVMGFNPSFHQGPQFPVEQVRWGDAAEYCRRLTERERAAGRISALQRFRMPTEAEWEYVARAGTTGPRHGDLDAIAWWAGNAPSETTTVRQKAPNAWGVYDMIGNAWEWVGDWFADYPVGPATDPEGPASGSDRVTRGGSWGYPIHYCRSAVRSHMNLVESFTNLSFRTVLVQ